MGRPENTILALDFGEKCGWCVRCPGITLAGVWNLKPNTYEGTGMRFVRFRRCLNNIKASYDLGHVAYEEVRRHLGTAAAHAYGGYQAVLMEWCETNHLAYEAVPVHEIKRFATGKAKASKADMVLTATKKWDVEIADDNEADARWLAEYVASQERGE